MFAAEDSLRVKHMAEVEKMCDLYDLDQLRGLNDRLGGAGAAVRELFLTELESFNMRLREERAKVAEISRGPGGASEGKAASHAKVGDGTVPSVQQKIPWDTIRGLYRYCMYILYKMSEKLPIRRSPLDWATDIKDTGTNGTNMYRYVHNGN